MKVFSSSFHLFYSSRLLSLAPFNNLSAVCVFVHRLLSSRVHRLGLFCSSQHVIGNLLAHFLRLSCFHPVFSSPCFPLVSSRLLQLFPHFSALLSFCVCCCSRLLFPLLSFPSFVYFSRFLFYLGSSLCSPPLLPSLPLSRSTLLPARFFPPSIMSSLLSFPHSSIFVAPLVFLFPLFLFSPHLPLVSSLSPLPHFSFCDPALLCPSSSSFTYLFPLSLCVLYLLSSCFLCLILFNQN